MGFRRKILDWLRISNNPVVKIYHGYGNPTEIVVFGHVFSISPLERKKYRKNIWTNTFALIRSFMIKTKPGVTVRLVWNDEVYETKTADDGFFRFDIENVEPIPEGLHEVEVQLMSRKNKDDVRAFGKGFFMVPHVNKYAFISDIDDTFLISHSSSVFKKLKVLLTKNAHTRKPFEGVVKHYQLLAEASVENGEANPFFYVSSSEWNLYNFIKEFARKNNMPEGVFLLSQIKKFGEMWKTGGNRHATKFIRIARVLEAYPHQQFVLLGDDSQMDPVIYASIVEHFPGRIACVYLRHVYDKNLTNVEEMKAKIRNAGIECCHFVHSKDAIEHSFAFGLINTLEVKNKVE